MSYALESIRIGEFTLRMNTDGKLWLIRDSGEAMEMNAITKDAFELFIRKFWDEHF